MTRVMISVLFAAAMSAHAAEPADYAVVVPITTTGDSAAWRVEVPLATHAWSGCTVSATTMSSLP